ncbi:hypothetical protein VNI00_013691 [Paramarasmius palmivorus]|uniref:Uncharacterized protein n=1 Tax=Paramarasmius palmivorus TaxID=297713 RepID=A0AAW0BXA8_9AGAR
MSPRLKLSADPIPWDPKSAACGSLTVSAINILIMIGLHGNEVAWICLTNCVIDVTVNSLFLFWVSAGSAPSECRDRFSLPRMDMSALTYPEPAALSPTRQRFSGTTSRSFTVGSSTLNMNDLPEEYYDYLPREHLKDEERGDARDEIQTKNEADTQHRNSTMSLPIPIPLPSPTQQ